MEELLEQGVGILILTSDYIEAVEMSHRVIVLHRGRICKEFQPDKAIEADILRSGQISDVTLEEALVVPRRVDINEDAVIAARGMGFRSVTNKSEYHP